MHDDELSSLVAGRRQILRPGRLGLGRRRPADARADAARSDVTDLSDMIGNPTVQRPYSLAPTNSAGPHHGQHGGPAGSATRLSSVFLPETIATAMPPPQAGPRSRSVSASTTRGPEPARPTPPAFVCHAASTPASKSTSDRTARVTAPCARSNRAPARRRRCSCLRMQVRGVKRRSAGGPRGACQNPPVSSSVISEKAWDFWPGSDF